MTQSPIPDAPRASLHVRGVRFDVRLGVTEEERAVPQAVEVDVLVRFEAEPAATGSDQVEDTVDYAGMVARMREALSGREFALVERLGRVLLDAVRVGVDADHGVEVRVRKVDPPVPEITGGAEFVLRDG